MSAPATTSAAVVDARAEHNRRHTAFKLHLDRCRHECRTGGLCAVGQARCLDADAAGWRLSDARKRAAVAVAGETQGAAVGAL